MPGYAPVAGGGGGAGERARCEDCGQVHIELFALQAGAYDAWVAEVVLRWQMWWQVSAFFGALYTGKLMSLCYSRKVLACS